MNRRIPNRFSCAAAFGAAIAAYAPLAAQRPADLLSVFDSRAHWIVPQCRAVPLLAPAASAVARLPQPIRVEAVRANVTLVDRTARTELEVALRNDSAAQAEGVLLLPVPAGAAVSSFAFDGIGSAPSARLLPAAEARAIYDEIVRRAKDPALLEFAGHALVRSSVFPVPPHGAQRVRLVYEHLLEQDGARLDYVLPRSESLDGQAPWSIEVAVRGQRRVATVYSPSHALAVQRNGGDRLHVRLADAAAGVPGSFRLSVLLAEVDAVTASLFACPDPIDGGGWFLLMAGLPPAESDARRGLRREITLVLDRSGSMSGGKLDQARGAALQVLEGLADGESFAIVDYASDVARFASPATVKDKVSLAAARAYLASLRPGGGTNLHGALAVALGAPPTPGTLPIVLFLTDGLPTVGVTTEGGIRALAEGANPHARRIFTFGVGHDVNVPLLDRLAEVSRATSTYVLPQEDVELKVAQVFKRLTGPVLSSAELQTVAADGSIDTRRVRAQQPGRIPDLFADDQLVVLGRYLGGEPLHFRLRGDWLGSPRTFAFRFDLGKATTANGFVPRLWASRRIAELVDEVRQAGAGLVPLAGGAHDPFADPRLRELRDEILALSTRFGILTEYTAFLATEGTPLADWNALQRSCGTALDSRAMQTRSGAGALSQASNLNAQRYQAVLNPANRWLDAQHNAVETTAVQQICDRAFFRRADRWIDGELVQQGQLAPDRVVRRGSPEHDALLRELVAEGRNAVLSLRGEVLLRRGAERVLVADEAP
jgi:Ca-activated chloride channel family protein